MIIYNPHNETLLNERLKEAAELLAHLPAKYCFISGSFFSTEKYRDIDVLICHQPPYGVLDKVGKMAPKDWRGKQ